MNSDIPLKRVTRELPPTPERGTQPLALAEPVRAPVGFGARRDIGRVRANNEDQLYAMLTTLPREEDDMLVGLFVVADGMGGHEGGEVASRLAIAAVVRSIASDVLLPTLDGAGDASAREAIETALIAANRAVHDAGRLNRSNMGTTCTAALLVGRSLTIGHIGDTRAYLIDPAGIRQLTSDHSAVGRLVTLGQISAAQARASAALAAVPDGRATARGRGRCDQRANWRGDTSRPRDRRAVGSRR